MSTCARCGRTVGAADGECFVDMSGDECEGALLPATVACREAELSNLRSLLRVATLQLERALTLLDDLNEPCSIRGDLESLLEKIS